LGGALKENKRSNTRSGSNCKTNRFLARHVTLWEGALCD